MPTIIQSVTEQWQQFLAFLPRLSAGLVILLISLWAGRLASYLLTGILNRNKISRTHANFFRSLIVWFFVFLGLIPTLDLLGLEKAVLSLLAGGGITAVILGFAFREIGENLLAGFFLAFSRPFNIGDLIQSEELIGEVKSIELRYTHIRTEDGRDIFIPSSQLFNKPVVNFTRDGLRRPSFVVGIDYGDDTEQAKKILFDAVYAGSGVLADPPALVTISAFMPQYVEMDISFWIDTFQEGISINRVRSSVMERCRRVLLDHGFTVSSNTTANLNLKYNEPLSIRTITPAGKEA